MLLSEALPIVKATLRRHYRRNTRGAPPTGTITNARVLVTKTFSRTPPRQWRAFIRARVSRDPCVQLKLRVELATALYKRTF